MLVSVLYNLNRTSVRQITLTSADPLAPPLIDPNYYSTEVDILIIRNALRKNMLVLIQTEARKCFIRSEVPPPRLCTLSTTSSDEELGHSVGVLADSCSHLTGTRMMGKVLDSELRIYEIEMPRVVFPSKIAAHNQVAVYAVAEKAADIIISDWRAY